MLTLNQLNNIFMPQTVAQDLKGLPKLKTSIMDLCFPGRRNSAFPLVSIQDILEVVGTVPMIRRGGMSVPLSSGTGSVSMIEPLPVKPSKDITGQDLNNLTLIIGNKASIGAWRTDTIDALRRACRNTTEAIAATALTGTISWPVRLDSGGWETYEVEYGTPFRKDPAALFTADGAGIAEVHEALSDMETAIQDGGYGGTVEFLAGRKAFSAIYALVVAVDTSAKMNLSIKGDTIDIGGYTVRKMSERYRDPKDGSMKAKVADGEIVGYATDAPATVIYSSLDDIDANLRPYPFFPKVISLPEGNGYRVIGQSKPLPARSPKSICWAKVA